MKNLGIITYNAPHLKTEQIVLNLFHKYHISVYALPFFPKPERKVLLQHRPKQSLATHPQELCRYLGIPFVAVDHDWEIDNKQDFYLIAGAGVLSEQCLQGKQILNGHPGVIPAVRGLDAFKWSIYDLKPLGVSLHYIDKIVDSGQVVSVVPTPVFTTESLETLARRHYENEIRLLSNFEEHIFTHQNPYENISMGERMRRMKFQQEEELEYKFALYKQMYCSQVTKWT